MTGTVLCFVCYHMKCKQWDYVHKSGSGPIMHFSSAKHLKMRRCERALTSFFFLNSTQYHIALVVFDACGVRFT